MKLWNFTLDFTLLLSNIFVCTYAPLEMQIRDRLRTIKLTSSISSFITYVHYLHLVLPYALMFSLSCSLFYMLYTLVPSIFMQIL